MSKTTVDSSANKPEVKDFTVPRTRGRPAKHYTTSWGETISGLSQRANGRFYPVGRSDISFGNDELIAINKYRRWLKENGGEHTPGKGVLVPYDENTLKALFPDDRIPIGGDRMTRAELEQWFKMNPPGDGQMMVTTEILRAYERNRIRHLILTDPKQAAAEMDIAHIAWYPEKPEKLQWNLAELCEYYLTNKRSRSGERLDKKHQKNSARWWKDFLDCIGVNEVRDISFSMIKKFYDQIMGRFDAKNLSADSVRLRFAKVKTVFKYGMDQAGKKQDKHELRRVLDMCAILQAPASISHPRPIDPSDFRALLEAAGVRERAVLLLGLNAAMHAGEVSNTLKSDVNLKKRKLESRRSKNAQPRVAWLWKRTVDAISDYQKKQGLNHSDYLFVSRTGRPLSGESIRQLMVTLRKQAALSKDVTFEGLRDAAYGIAEQVDAHHAKFIAGHKTGMSDKYVLRQADNPCVKDCCNAIEKHFFGSKK